MSTDPQTPPSVEIAQAIAAGMPPCPSCAGKNTRPSQRASLVDHLLYKFNYAAFRCRTCQHRFYKRLRQISPA